MARPIQQTEFKAILDCLVLFPNGASINDIRSNLKISLPVYTVRRRLNILIDEGKVFSQGKGRALRYQLAKSLRDEPEKEEQIVLLSSSSQNILSEVAQPIQSRTPIGYNRKFLDEYRPNVTSYLSEVEKNELAELGKTDGERPAGTYAREIFNRILIDLSWNSSRLEGNTYSLLETERLLEFSEAAEGKDLKETQMVLNHKAAIEFLIDSADHIDIDKQTVLSVHALLSDNLLIDPQASGRLRSKSVGIGKSVYHPLVVPDLISECFSQVLDTARAIKNPFEQSFFLMVHLPYLQPFEDVNKRVSRLVANIPMIRLNLAPLSFMDVPQKTYINGLLAIYELNKIDLLKDVFVWAYKRSCALYSATCQSLGEPDPVRLRYRKIIFDAIGEVVRKRMNKRQAVLFIRSLSNETVPNEDQSRFIETVEKELRGLHEGNIARYKLTISEYNSWLQGWS
ncbi:MAG: Fic family protein [Chlamydiia bacterium]|nr:Fic family protein [Chlamydiia bacterium]